ncbi:MAG: hypothetical protein ACRDNL_20645, partial [Spirillospora sp.]
PGRTPVCAAPRPSDAPRPPVPDQRADTDTQAFTPIGMAGAMSSTRARLLAGLGAAAGTVVIGAILAGRTQERTARRLAHPARHRHH